MIDPGKEEASGICGQVPGIQADEAPKQKNQVESAIRYRISKAEEAPEQKKQVESAVRYRVSKADGAPEKKK